MIRLSLHGAATEAEEERSWVCAWCPTMIEERREGAEHCERCTAYIADIEQAVFDMRWDDAR